VDSVLLSGGTATPTTDTEGGGDGSSHSLSSSLNSSFEYYRTVDNSIKLFEELSTIHEKDKNFWNYMGEKNTVQMFDREDGQFTYLKAICEIDRPPKELIALLKDQPSLPKWSPLVKKGEVIEQIDSHTDIVYLLYETTACLITMRRDFCMTIHWFQRPDGAYLYVGQSVEHPHCPPFPNITRGFAHNSGYLLVPRDELPYCGKSTIVTFVTKLNLNGLPKPAISYAKYKQLQAVYFLKKYVMSRT